MTLPTLPIAFVEALRSAGATEEIIAAAEKAYGEFRTPHRAREAARKRRARAAKRPPDMAPAEPQHPPDTPLRPPDMAQEETKRPPDTGLIPPIQRLRGRLEEAGRGNSSTSSTRVRPRGRRGADHEIPVGLPWL
jgi:hypothetical protein